MYFNRRRGNDKIGEAVVLNRPTGTTCPSNCPLLGNGCYAEKTEHRFPRAKPATLTNLTITEFELSTLLDFAKKQGKDVRVHERGDFFYNGKLDRKYLTVWKKTLKKIVDKPKIWLYTHIYHKDIATLQDSTCQVYASVSTETDVKKAKQAGFKLFAWSLANKKRRGGSKEFPSRVDLPILGKTLVCPEQRLGRKVITCDKCRWCIEGKGNVAFLKS